MPLIAEQPLLYMIVDAAKGLLIPFLKRSANRGLAGLLVPGLICALVLPGSACKGRKHQIKYKDEQVEPEPSSLGLSVPHAREADDILPPPAADQPGPAQIAELWAATERAIRSDLESGLEDEEYLMRRDPMLTRWFALYFEQVESFRKVGLESSEIVELLNQVYGFSADPEHAEQRARIRRDRQALEQKIAAITAKVRQLH